MDGPTKESRNGTSEPTQGKCPYPWLALIPLAMLIEHTMLVFRKGALSGPLDTPTLTAGLVLVSVPVAIQALVRNIARCRHGTSRGGLLGRVVPLMVLGAGAVGFALSPGFLFSHPLAAWGFRLNHAADVQGWVLPLLHLPRAKLPKDLGLDTSYAGPAVPDSIRRLHHGGQLWVRIVRPNSQSEAGFFKTDPNTPYMVIGWDEDIVGWGLLVGPETFQPRGTDNYRVHRLAPGIYRWD